jgi:hypothetical protein
MLACHHKGAQFIGFEAEGDLGLGSGSGHAYPHL